MIVQDGQNFHPGDIIEIPESGFRPDHYEKLEVPAPKPALKEPEAPKEEEKPEPEKKTEPAEVIISEERPEKKKTEPKPERRRR